MAAPSRANCKCARCREKLKPRGIHARMLAHWRGISLYSHERRRRCPEAVLLRRRMYSAKEKKLRMRQAIMALPNASRNEVALDAQKLIDVEALKYQGFLYV